MNFFDLPVLVFVVFSFVAHAYLIRNRKALAIVLYNGFEYKFQKPSLHSTAK
jgi:hypothetical protein